MTRVLAVPLGAHVAVAFAREMTVAQALADAVAGELAQGPDRHGAHQRRGIAEQRLDARQQGSVARVAGGDQHVAHEAVAARALDRRAGKARAESRIVEREQLGERRVVGLGARGKRASRAVAANLFHGQTARQSSQPKMRLPMARRNSAGMWPLCSIVR